MTAIVSMRIDVVDTAIAANSTSATRCIMWIFRFWLEIVVHRKYDLRFELYCVKRLQKIKALTFLDGRDYNYILRRATELWINQIT